MSKSKILLSVTVWTVAVIWIAQAKKRRIANLPKGSAHQGDQNRSVPIFKWFLVFMDTGSIERVDWSLTEHDFISHIKIPRDQKFEKKLVNLLSHSPNHLQCNKAKANFHLFLSVPRGYVGNSALCISYFENYVLMVKCGNGRAVIIQKGVVVCQTQNLER